MQIPIRAEQTRVSIPVERLEYELSVPLVAFHFLLEEIEQDMRAGVKYAECLRKIVAFVQEHNEGAPAIDENEAHFLREGYWAEHAKKLQSSTVSTPTQK